LPLSVQASSTCIAWEKKGWRLAIPLLYLAKQLFASRSGHGGTEYNQDRFLFANNQCHGATPSAPTTSMLARPIYSLTLRIESLVTRERIWTTSFHQKMYITGGCGALYDVPNPRRAKIKRASPRSPGLARNYQLP